MKKEVSKTLFSQAQKSIPGGVSSPVRACKSVGCDPRFITKAAGSKVYDADGNEYIDFICSWGPMILGHAHPEVVASLGQTSHRSPGPSPSLSAWPGLESPGQLSTSSQ